MKFTLNWLKNYLETDASLQEISDKLTMIGLEVEKIEDRLQAKNNISLLKMKQTLKEQNAPSGITCKDAFDYPLDLSDSILNIPQEAAMQENAQFLYSWILFNYPEVSEVEKIEIYKNPINYLLQVNTVIAA